MMFLLLVDICIVLGSTVWTLDFQTILASVCRYPYSGHIQFYFQRCPFLGISGITDVAVVRRALHVIITGSGGGKQ
jgi:hypothetical protein